VPTEHPQLVEISPSTGSHQTCLQERGRKSEKSATPGLWRAIKREKMGSDEVHKGGGGCGGTARNGEDGPRGLDRATTGHDLMDHATPNERKEVV
jgi:hypothetical protein